MLYGYGIYEISIDPGFSIARLSLLDRGFVFAIAHIRGGGEMGRPLVRRGQAAGEEEHLHRLRRRAAEHLVEAGWTRATGWSPAAARPAAC